MSRLILRLVVNAIALWVAIKIIPGIDHDGSTLSLLAIALVFGLVNALIRPILLFLTCPMIILTLGVFILLVNTLMLWLTGQVSDALGLGLVIDGFWPTFLGALVISVVSGLMNTLIKDSHEDKRHEQKKGY